MLAHVKWFTDPAPFPTRYELLLSGPVLAAVALALAAVGAAWLVQHRVPEPAVVRSLERFARSGPLVLALHIGVALVVAAVAGLLFVPSLRLERDGLGYAIQAGELVCGVLFLVGLYTRAAAVLLAALGVLAMAPYTVEGILEQVHILGIALFFFVAGRGPVSLDRARGARPPFRGEAVPDVALLLVRVAMGFGIAYTALTEKLLNPPLALSLLERHPGLNLVRPLGIGDPLFVWLAGATELAIGLVIVSGQLTRPVMAVGAVLFTSTLVVFGWPELLGHLPFFGIMFLLLIAPNADRWQTRRALRPVA